MSSESFVSIRSTAIILLLLLITFSIPTALALHESTGEGWHMIDVREMQVVTHGKTLIIYFEYDIDIFMKFSRHTFIKYGFNAHDFTSFCVRTKMFFINV